jgi:small GTP-binding protein
MDLERERGITIKSHAIQMNFDYKDENYILNLIDTPGHVDFSYEVSRSIAACEGALLIVDASQGIEAQTISNLYLALEHDLEIIPILSKMDLPGAEPEEVTDQIVELIGCSREDVIPASGKTGFGVDAILEAIIHRIPNPKGDTLRLTDYKGKVVLIDFWASWCGPCRIENPNVVRLYNKYKGEKFEIFSVSLDKDKEKWIKAIKADGLIWDYHVSDLLGWQTTMVEKYQFNGIPHTVLIDPEGKIIAEKLRGPSLERKLQELFGK